MKEQNSDLEHSVYSDTEDIPAQYKSPYLP